MAAIAVVAFEDLAKEAIEDLAKQVLGDIIQAIKDLITNPADNPTRSAFTQSNLDKAASLCKDPVNVIVVFQHDGHDASDLTNNGWKMGMLKCPCPHAGNTLQCMLLKPFKSCPLLRCITLHSVKYRV